ncbi:1723_t:CDS:2 [Paraglomus occultum]|uniref:1723_t:CDS:1 n=1 Tax=Paraglomus occultum TaxID=144539 RepID=A0A9N9GA43_9GLOM|nr:1723_t:CDS:2 [Paraglomus occultum]
MASLNQRHTHSDHSDEDSSSVNIYDEQEQEQLIASLKAENDRVNNFFRNPLDLEIPLPLPKPVPSTAPYPALSTICSLLSLLVSAYIVKSPKIEMSHVYSGLFVSFVPLLVSHAIRKGEVLWWGIPLGMFMVNVVAVYWIKESEGNLRDFEKLKYNYKGA